MSCNFCKNINPQGMTQFCRIDKKEVVRDRSVDCAHYQRQDDAPAWVRVPDAVGSPAELFGVWIDVSVKKPAVGKKVIVCGRYAFSGKSWRTVAMWQPAGSIDAEFWDDPPEDWWNAEKGVFTNPEDMWSEESIESEISYALSGVTHWMPLPDAPSA